MNHPVYYYPLDDLELGQRVCRHIKQKFEVFQRDGVEVLMVPNPKPDDWPYGLFQIVSNIELSPPAKSSVGLSVGGFLAGWRAFQDEMEKAELIRLEKERLTLESKIKKALRASVDRAECEACDDRVWCLEHNCKEFLHYLYPDANQLSGVPWVKKPPCALALTIHGNQIKAWVKDREWVRDWHPVATGRFGKRKYTSSKYILREVRERLRRNFILDRDCNSIQFYWCAWSDAFIKKEEK